MTLPNTTFWLNKLEEKSEKDVWVLRLSNKIFKDKVKKFFDDDCRITCAASSEIMTSLGLERLFSAHQLTGNNCNEWEPDNAYGYEESRFRNRLGASIITTTSTSSKTNKIESINHLPSTELKLI